MEDLIHFENFSVNNIIFLDFMKKSNEVLITIPKIDVFQQFPSKNAKNLEKYKNEWKDLLSENSIKPSKQKETIILGWAKQNDYPLATKYNENDLSSFIDDKLFPEYEKIIKRLREDKSMLLKLLNLYIIENLTRSIRFLLSIKNGYIKKKGELSYANESYRKLFEQSDNVEKELMSKNNSLEKKISFLNKEIKELSSKNENLIKEKEILNSEISGYTLDFQSNEQEMSKLRYEIDSVKNELKTVQNKLKESESRNNEFKSRLEECESKNEEFRSRLEESESKNEEFRNRLKESESQNESTRSMLEKRLEESESKYDALINLMKEILNNFSSDLTLKIQNTTKEIQNKLDDINKKK